MMILMLLNGCISLLTQMLCSRCSLTPTRIIVIIQRWKLLLVAIYIILLLLLLSNNIIISLLVLHLLLIWNAIVACLVYHGLLLLHLAGGAEVLLVYHYLLGCLLLVDRVVVGRFIYLIWKLGALDTVTLLSYAHLLLLLLVNHLGRLDCCLRWCAWLAWLLL